MCREAARRSPPHRYARARGAPAVPVHPARDHVFRDEVAEDGHADLKGDGEGDVVEHAQARRHEGDLALGERAGAGGLRDLLFFEAVG